MARLDKVPQQVRGGALVLPLLGLALLFIPRQKLRLLLAVLAAALQEHRRLPELNSRRRVRLPGYGWRAVTLVTIVALIGCDPAFDRLWTAQAQCTLPPNYSSDYERITEFVYDLDGRLTQVNSPEGVINYSYQEATGRHIRTCTKNSEVHYGYDELGRLKTVHVTKRNGSSVEETTTYTYTKVGSRESVTLPNGVVTRYLYDSLNRLTNLTHKAGGTDLLASYSYQLHETGRRTNAVEIIKTEDAQTPWITNNLSWAYDGMYRLTNEVCVTSKAGASYTNRYEYDKVGNRHKKTRIANSGTTTIDYTYNANDQLTSEQSSADGATSYGYDDNGSLIAKTNSSATILYGYNLANKLSEVTKVGSGVTNHFVYNDSGIRVRSWSSAGGSPTLFLVDANNHTGYAQVLEELTALGGTPTRSYVIGDDVLAQGSSAASYLLYDGHGSTRQLADATGAVMSRYNYDAYGLTETATSSAQAETSLLYCGEQYDSSLEMYNLRARYYNQNNGRFNQRDSFLGYNEDPQSLHKYAYAECDPTNAIDPSGMMSSTEILTVSAIVGLTAGMMLGSLVAAKRGYTYKDLTFWKITLGFGIAGALVGVGAGYIIISVSGVTLAGAGASTSPVLQQVTQRVEALIPTATTGARVAQQATGWSQGGLTNLEYQLAQRIGQLEGWTNFTGAANRVQAGYDGIVSGRLIQLKQLVSSNPANILTHLQRSASSAEKSRLKAIEAYVSGSKYYAGAAAQLHCLFPTG